MITDIRNGTFNVQRQVPYNVVIFLCFAIVVSLLPLYFYHFNEWHIIARFRV